ncbi:hypothetical protein PIB30_047804 [Stylosanthes scabra]|uniref:Uncharacterized protein n=1 Tax=Stylosanthes scabra TaxID=79078 RepID=A0ABU6WGX8_9FABA|nr:hypothetical protein [Stylosanthes scabra]
MAENLQGDQAAERVVQIPRELPFIYRWVINDVLDTPSSLDQQYLEKLKLTVVLFGGGDLEWRYRVEAARRGERVCFLNLDHPTVPHWLWVNEVMFTEFGVRVPFSNFQQRLLNRASVAPSPLHPNPWSSICCFELVTEFLELAQDPETKKGYMSARPGKNRKIFALYEDSFHDFKGRYFKIFPVGDHRPFWLSLEGDGRFPPILERSGRFRDRSGHVSAAQRPPWKWLVMMSPLLVSGISFVHLLPEQSLPRRLVGRTRVVHEGGSSSEAGKETEQLVDISSPIREEEESLPASTSSWKRSGEESLAGSKRPRLSEGGSREFSAIDHSFDASGFIGFHLLGPQASEALRDYDLVESVRWAEWAMLRSATILKSIEPHLTVADEVERRNEKLVGDVKVLNLQKVVLEEEEADAIAAELKAEEDFKLAGTALEALRKEKDEEIERLKHREADLVSEAERLRGLVAEEKVRADLSEIFMSELKKQCEELVEDAKAAVSATKGALKAQLAILAPDFD